MLKRFLLGFMKTVAVAAFWILIWFAAAEYVGKELLLPSPLSVLKRLAQIASEKEFYMITAHSLLRITLGILFASFLSVLLAILTHISKIANALASPIITVIKATPVASFIILALLWLKRGDLPIFIAVLMVLPIMWTNLKTGLLQVDKGLLEMGRVFKIGTWQTLRGIYIPSVLPYFIAAAKTSLGLAWKAGIAAEVLAVPTRSIGKELFDSKAYFETADLFAWTVVVILLSLIIELIFEALIGILSAKRRMKKNA